MLRLHFLLAWRNILKRRFYSSIEIIGLAVGLACFFIVLLHIKKEISYETSFTDYKHIYRVLNLEQGSGNRYSGGASAIGFHAKTDIAQVEDVVRVFFPYKMFTTSALVRYEDQRFFEDNILEADSNFFHLFDFKFIEGDRRTALQHANSIVLSQKAAVKLFGDESAVGKLISIDDDRALIVTGVAEVPDNTHLNFDFLRPAHNDPSQLYVWEQTLAFTYLKIRPGSDLEAVQKQIYDIVLKYSTQNNAEYLKNYFHQLQPLNDIHTTIIQWDITQGVSTKQLWAIFAIAVFILMLAIVNFVNLATARSAERIRETGINKILGATQRRLTIQFFMEFIVVTAMAGVIALVLLSTFIEPFNSLMNTSVTISEFMRSDVLLAFLLVLLFTAVASGVYPAYRLSTFKPVQVVKRNNSIDDQPLLRGILVVFQFVISIGLLSGTLIVQRQIRFMQEADLGFDKEQIFVLRLRSSDHHRFEQLKNELMRSSQIVKIGGASALLGGEPGSETFHPDHMPDPTPETFAKNIAVDQDFLDLIGVPVLAGRNFQKDNPNDYSTAYIINETAVKQFQLTDPVGANFRRGGQTSGKIIGVMKDFHFAKMTDRINPMVFFMDSVRSNRYMLIKLGGDISAGVEGIQQTWARIIPGLPMEGFFQDAYFDSLYRQERQIARITTWFSVLAILLASLGLFGMSSFVILKRTKEIGIRKVVGASVSDILILLSGNLIRWIVIAFLISVPLTVYLLHLWLQDFVVRISITPSFFVAAGVLTLVVALVTIGYQSVRAALASPVEAMRD
jgi:putative ABC transport system permease protein